MATGRHLVASTIVDEYVERLAKKADAIPVGNPMTEQVALGPLIDETQRDRVHEMVTATADVGATVAAGGTYEGLFYRPTVLADVPTDSPAYANEVFGPVVPITPFGDLDEAVALATGTDYGLSLGILTRDVMKGVELADRIPSGIVPTSMTRRSAMRRSHRSVAWAGRAPGRGSVGRGEHRRLYGDPVAHAAGDNHQLSVLTPDASISPSVLGGEIVTIRWHHWCVAPTTSPAQERTSRISMRAKKAER